jgi:1,4-dihydroxy-2-naphthoate octaprenyltransferase
MLVPYVLVTGFVLRGVFPQAGWLPWFTLPLSLVRAVLRGAEGRSLNAVLKGTTQLHLFFGILLAGGLLL